MKNQTSISAPSFLKFCSDIAGKYQDLENGNYTSENHKIVKESLRYFNDEKIHSPVIVGMTTGDVKISDDLYDWKYSSLIFWLIWGFYRKDSESDFEADHKTYELLKVYSFYNHRDMLHDSLDMLHRAKHTGSMNGKRIDYLTNPDL